MAGKGQRSVEANDLEGVGSLGAHLLITREASHDLLPHAFDLLTGALQLLFS